MDGLRANNAALSDMKASMAQVKVKNAASGEQQHEALKTHA